ncbi:MAG TPA: DUF1552 domain-containing protein [Polyangiaceae bacterium]|jgi:hypothetical protein|nr:DUF1552 domain-containing protein [Polyangiaceae bacterium]
MQNVRLVRATKILERRIFLKALALGLTLPAALRLARTATAAPTAAPKRFFLLYMPHGVAPEHYNPKVSDTDRTMFALDQTNVSILGPLQKYNSYVNVYQGFKYLAGSTHSSLLSCLSGLDGGPSFTDETTPRTSVEHVIANALGVKPLILGACSHQAYGLDTNGKLFWDGTAVDPQKNPAAAADALFGAPTTGTTRPPVNADAELRKDLLALTAGEIQSLQTSLNGLTTEQTKLQRHLEAINGIQSGNGMNAGVSSCMGAPSLPTVDMVRAASAGNVVTPGSGNDYFYQEANFPLLYQAQLELIAQALVCNAAQVAALMPMFTTCDFNFSFSKQANTPAASNWAHHAGLSHTSPAASSTFNASMPTPNIANADPNQRAAFAGAQLWFAQQLDKYVLSVLANTDDPSAPGTKVLDNTLIYWMSEIGDGANHTTMSSTTGYPPMPQYLPLVTIGKAGGAFKSGQIVQYATDRPAGDLYLSLCKAMGVSSATFPSTTGPVTEVLT